MSNDDTNSGDEELVRMPFRLAFRTEGDFVNAYLADQNTMKDALLIGSVRTNSLVGDEDFWPRWKGLMTDILSSHLRSMTGADPVMVEEKAPEHEKSGRA